MRGKGGVMRRWGWMKLKRKGPMNPGPGKEFIDLEFTHDTRGKILEGILNQVYEELSDEVFASGDSNIVEDKTKFEKSLSGLNAVKTPHIHPRRSSRKLVHSELVFTWPRPWVGGGDEETKQVQAGGILSKMY